MSGLKSGFAGVGVKGLYVVAGTERKIGHAGQLPELSFLRVMSPTS